VIVFTPVLLVLRAVDRRGLSFRSRVRVPIFQGRRPHCSNHRAHGRVSSECCLFWEVQRRVLQQERFVEFGGVLTRPLTFFVAGELRHIHKLRFWPLEEVLHDKYLLSKEESIMIASFINPMLHLHPDKRATASETLEHELISGIVVQGEVDQLVRQEEEARRAQIRSESSGSIGSPMQEVLSSSEVPPSGPVASSSGGGKKKKKKNRASAALAKVDAEAIEVAEATNARRAADDASAMKPIDEAVYAAAAAAAAASADPAAKINGNGGPVSVPKAGSNSRASTSRGGKSKSHSNGGQGRNTST